MAELPELYMATKEERETIAKVLDDLNDCDDCPLRLRYSCLDMKVGGLVTFIARTELNTTINVPMFGSESMQIILQQNARRSFVKYIAEHFADDLNAIGWHHYPCR